MEIIGEFFKIDTDKGIWEYFSLHWKSWFPGLGSRTNFVRQATNLWQVKQEIQVRLSMQLNAFSDHVHFVDGFPMPNQVKLFSADAAYGYCASKDEKYYGFKGNLAINSIGVISGISVTAANVDERKSMFDFIYKIKGLLTVICQLTERFNMAKIRARDLWHLSNRVTRKILSHTMAIFINSKIGRDPLSCTSRIVMDFE